MKITKKSLIAVTLLFLIINTAACATESHIKNSIKTHHTTLWQLIDQLIDHPSFTLDKIGHAFPFEFTERGDNGYFSFYNDGRLSASGQIDIAAILLRVRNEDETHGMISLYLDPENACVTLDDVHGQFPSLVITETPRGHSPDEETYWSIQQPWGNYPSGSKSATQIALPAWSLTVQPPPTHQKPLPQAPP